MSMKKIQSVTLQSFIILSFTYTHTLNGDHQRVARAATASAGSGPTAKQWPS